jgi:RNA polymerase sigma factor (sigma-70 family)
MTKIPSQGDIDMKVSRLQRCLATLGNSSFGVSEAARDDLITLAAERMRSIAHRMLRGFPQVRRWEETDDVVQNAALRLHRALTTVVPRDEKHLISLAALQIRRELLDMARRFSTRDSFAKNLDTNVVHGASKDIRHVDVAAADCSESHDRIAVWTRFHEAIARLPDEERQVFDLVWYLGAEQEEIGRILGCSGRTVRRRWDATKQTLVQALKGEMPE